MSSEVLSPVGIDGPDTVTEEVHSVLERFKQSVSVSVEVRPPPRVGRDLFECGPAVVAPISMRLSDLAHIRFSGAEELFAEVVVARRDAYTDSRSAPCVFERGTLVRPTQPDGEGRLNVG